MTTIQKAVDHEWPLLFVGVQNVALVSVKIIILWMQLNPILDTKIVARFINLFNNRRLV